MKIQLLAVALPLIIAGLLLALRRRLARDEPAVSHRAFIVRSPRLNATPLKGSHDGSDLCDAGDHLFYSRARLRQSMRKAVRKRR